MTPARWLLLGAVVFTVLAWSSAFVVIRGAGSHLDGGALALGRLAVGAAALGILALLARRWVWPTRREWLQLLLYGVAWFGVYNIALNTAEQTLDAGTAAMIVNLGPILIALGAGLVLREGIPRWLAVGAAVAFVGVVLIGIGTSLAQDTSKPVDVVGALLALAAAITYAVGVIAQKPVLRRIPGIQTTFIGCVIGLVVCLPFSGALVTQLAAAPAAVWWQVIYLGVVPTALAFSTWAYALSRMPTGQLGISTYLAPPLATLMGFLAFGEIPHVLALIGGVVCLLGVALSRRSTAPAQVSPPVAPLR